jgi:predicted ATPase
MLLHAKLGDRSAAVHQYEACVEILKKELGVAPQADTTSLYEKIIRGDIKRELPEQTQISAASVHSSSHLPLLPTPFMGRRPEVEQIKTLVMSPDHRLVTLIGPGGIGKTRLSIQSASELVGEFRDGVWFVPLAPLQSAEAMLPALANALDFCFYRQEERPRQQLIDYLREKQLLLVLDNFEHLIHEGTGLIEEILATAKDLKLFVTSRERLNLQGEQLYPVAGMRTPKATEVVAWDNPEEQAKSFSALQLFVERARRVQPNFRLTQDNLEAVAEICKLVDGMPLGIELAAGWIEVLTPKEIVAEVTRSLDFLETDLQDVSNRQRSIRAVFESSWKLLSEEEQKVFQKLTVFRGSFSREAAQRVSGASIRMLLGLANKSWLQQVEGGRFALHEVLRQYGYEHLLLNPEEWQTANDRHADYYLDFVQELEQGLRSAKQIEAVNTLNKEFENNIQAAWDWLIERKRFGDLVNRMLPGIFHFSLIRTPAILVPMVKRARKAFPESQSGEDLLQRAILETVETSFEINWDMLEDQPKERLLQLLATVEEFGLADDLGSWYFVLILAYRQGIDAGKEFRDFQKLLQKPEIKQDPWVFGYGLLVEYQNSMIAGADEVEREKYLMQALEVFQQIGVVHEQAITFQLLGETAKINKSFDRAVHFKQAALELYEKAGDPFGAGMIWFDLAQIHLSQGNLEQACHAYQEQRRIYEKAGNRRLIGINLSWESMATSRYGALEHALETRKRSLEIAQEENSLNDLSWALWEMGELYRLMGNFEQAKIWYQKSLPYFEKIQDNNGIGFYFRGLGDIALELKQWEEAYQQFQKSIHALTYEHRAWSTWSLAYVQAGLGRALIGLGKFPEAREVLQKAIHNTQEYNSWDLIFVPLVGFARLFVALGEPQRAIELAEFIFSDPLSWNETKNQAREVLEEASRNLPENVAQAALRRSQAMTMDKAVELALRED